MPPAREAKRYHARQLLHFCRKEGIGNERRLERSAHVASADRDSLVDLALQRFARVVGVAWCCVRRPIHARTPCLAMRTDREHGVNRSDFRGIWLACSPGATAVEAKSLHCLAMGLQPCYLRQGHAATIAALANSLKFSCIVAGSFSIEATTTRTSCSLVISFGMHAIGSWFNITEIPTTWPAHMPASVKCWTTPPGFALPVRISSLITSRSCEAMRSKVLQSGSM